MYFSLIRFSFKWLKVAKFSNQEQVFYLRVPTSGIPYRCSGPLGANLGGVHGDYTPLDIKMYYSLCGRLDRRNCAGGVGGCVDSTGSLQKTTVYLQTHNLFFI